MIYYIFFSMLHKSDEEFHCRIFAINFTLPFMKILCACLFICFCYVSPAQSFIIKDIRSFGATGDGKTNDQAAFKKASDYFNQRGGNGKLFISKGTYIVGTQVFTGGQLNKPAYEGNDILTFNGVKNFILEGENGSVIKYRDGQRIGAFSPTTGNVYDHGDNLFLDFKYAAVPGICIYLLNCSEVKILNMDLDGNNGNMILGGVYGDVGRQIPHTGIFILNSKNVLIESVQAHHFGLDGITISNKDNDVSDSIFLANSDFEYNSRQGLSWVGGNFLNVKNCKFNHTGKSKFYSPPGAGVDIEAEGGSIKNGSFDSCEFINNTGVGLLALAGDSRDCFFKNCIFWGSSNRAIWINKPGYSFYNCNVYGSLLQGCDAGNDNDATKFYTCLFEDTVYNGLRTYGDYLVESHNVKRMSFTYCTFISKIKKLCFLSAPDSFSIQQRYQLNNCKFIIENTNLPANDFIAITEGVVAKNCIFNFTTPRAKQNGYNFENSNPVNNPGSSGSKILYEGK